MHATVADQALRPIGHFFSWIFQADLELSNRPIPHNIAT